MRVTHLELRNFRNYGSLTLDFENNLTVIQGTNGSGKTNLAEAVYYLSLAKSWRTNECQALIRYGEDHASIKAKVEENGLRREIEIFILSKGRKISINGKPARRLSELSKLVNVTLFSPEDVLIFKGSPGDRRSFLDTSLSKKSLDYFNLIGKYNRLLLERNAALKAEKVDLTLIQVLTEELIAISEPISRYRRQYIDDLNKVLSNLASELYGHDRRVLVVYKPFIKNESAWKEEAEKAYKRSLDGDIIHKSTSIGIHREDFSLMLDGQDVALYGSQGENRLAAIALKIAPFFLIEDKEKRPIVVLDDVYSELDAEHTKRLSNLITKHLNQVFVTATRANIEGASVIEVSENKAIRR